MLCLALVLLQLQEGNLGTIIGVVLVSDGVLYLYVRKLEIAVVERR